MASPPTRSVASPGSSGGSSSAAILLGRQFKQMQTDKDIPGISCGLVGNSVFEWEIMIMLDEEQDTLYGGTIADHTPPSYRCHYAAREPR
jgi:ubiquitin-conjugating enzyme E2 G1